MATPPNITALFTGKLLIVNPKQGGNISPVLTGTVHLPIKHNYNECTGVQNPRTTKATTIQATTS